MYFPLSKILNAQWIVKSGKMAQKFKKGDDFTLDDFREQLREMKKMGGMMSMLEKLPGAKTLPDHVKNQVDDKKCLSKWKPSLIP